jgi:hypothetical protein
MKAFQSNYKRSRLIKKSNEDLLLEILIRVEKTGSFCPEKLMSNGNHQLFEEAYRRFETWDEIVEQCIKLSNRLELNDTISKTPKEVILEILILESNELPLQEADVRANQPDLHTVAILYYGSWNHALTIAGLKNYECLEP